MQAVIEACLTGRLAATPCVVISNNSDAAALVRARHHGIPAYHVSTHTHPGPEQCDAEILRRLRQHDVELVILAGYLRKVGTQTLHWYRDRILNLHPALLPKFGGQGMYGNNVHAAVLAAGETETGITIHVVDEAYDHGPIMAQCRILVLPDDTVESLAHRVGAREQGFVVETLEQILGGALVLPLAEKGVEEAHCPERSSWYE
jgi:phosphoribosylglycinamide formyltransferase-1